MQDPKTLSAARQQHWQQACPFVADNLTVDCPMCLPALSPVLQPLSITQPSHRTRLTTVALVNTGSLWQYTCEDDPAPVLVARVTGRGVDCGIDESTKLLQPQVRVCFLFRPENRSLEAAARGGTGAARSAFDHFR